MIQQFDSALSINIQQSVEPEVKYRHKELQRHILPIVEILGRISPELAHMFTHTAPSNPKVMKASALVSNSVNMALHAWAAILIEPHGTLTNDELLLRAESKRCFDIRDTDDLEIPDLAKKFFTRLAPYVRVFAIPEDKIIDTINWSDTILDDMVVDVCYIRLW